MALTQPLSCQKDQALSSVKWGNASPHGTNSGYQNRAWSRSYETKSRGSMQAPSFKRGWCRLWRCKEDKEKLESWRRKLHWSLAMTPERRRHCGHFGFACRPTFLPLLGKESCLPLGMWAHLKFILTAETTVCSLAIRLEWDTRLPLLCPFWGSCSWDYSEAMGDRGQFSTQVTASFLWESRTESGHNFPVFLGPLTYRAIFLVPPLGSLTPEVASEGSLLRYSSASRMCHHLVGHFSLKADTEQSYLHHYAQSYMLDPEGSKANLQFKTLSFFFFQTPGCCN